MTTLTQTDLVSVDVDGRQAAWDGTSFTGDPQIVASAQLSATVRAIITVHGNDVVSGTETVGEAAAALASWSPGRTIFPIFPDEAATEFGLED